MQRTKLINICIFRSLLIRELYEGYPRVYASLLKESSIWVLESEKLKSFEYAVNIDSPPPLVFFPTIGIKVGSFVEA